MNTIYKSKWSESTQTWVACSELARGKCKSNGLKIVAAVALALASTSVIAAPGSTSTITTSSTREQNHFHDSQGVYSEVNYKGMHTSTGKIIQNDSSNFDINIDGHYTIEGNITSTDTPNGEKAGLLTINNDHGIIKNGITNEGSGDIIINNQFLIDSDITSTQDSTGNITINNKDDLDIPVHNNLGDKERYRAINGKITNQGSGIFEINNESKLRGDISNTGFGTITLNNSGTSTGNIINDSDSASSRIEVTNDAGKTLESTISNIKAGTVELTNNGETTGAITNSGVGAITLNNSGETTGAITNEGTGAITLKNNGETTGAITNSGAGAITLKNSGKSTGDIINSGTQGSLISVANNNGATLNGKISNTGAGTIILENSGVRNDDIINNGDSLTSKIEVTNHAGATLGSTISNTKSGKIILTNQGKTTGTITNSGVGAITLNNSGETSGAITNKGAGAITLDNSGETTGAITNSDAGAITLNNSGETTGAITNSDAGAITLNNSGTSTGNIINNSDSASSRIEVTNDAGKTLESTISNIKAGTVELTNNGKTTGTITNSGAGAITLNNSGETTGTITNSGAGAITLNNSGETTGAITNSDAGAITLNNSGETTGTITNSGAGAITLKNSGTSTGNIINDSDSLSSKIEVTNHAGKTLGSTIRNIRAGTIELTNQGTTTGNIANLGDSDSSIHINNEGLLKSKIANMGSGQVTLINSGIGDNTEIINSGDGEIIVRNNKTLHNTNIINEMHGTGNISFTNNDKFEGDLINNADLGSIAATNTGIFTGTTNNSGANGKINLDNQGIWINTGDSTLSQMINTGTIEFSKIPLADINDENKYHTITIQGDYTGGGTIYVNTLWNDDSISKNGTGYTDRVNIEGDVTSGVTTVATREGIYGDITQKEIPITHPKTVIHVDGQITGQGFEGTSATKNAGEAQLRKTDQSLYGRTGTDYAWTLTAKIPTDPAKPTPPKEVPIYAEPVSAYVQMPTADMELGFTTIGTLYERRAENQTYNITGVNNTALDDKQQQTWGRIVVKHLDKNGKQRLDTAGNQSVLQIGHDFILDENNKTGTRRHIGGYVAYGHNENDFRDQYRAENGYVVGDHYTGKGRTDAVSVGGYGTFYGNNGGYVDLVGQVTYLRNKYNARTNESVHQNGWGAAVSAEAGKSFTVYGNNWFVEPQAQLVYQYLSLDNFNDGIRHVDQHNPSALRGRVGMRFGYNGATTDTLPPASFYGITNIWHNFVNPKSVDIGRDSLKEEYAKTWGEVGVGIQLPITRQSHFYGDVRYEKNFGSDKHKGFKGTLGYKYTWL
ncbi:autotransporter outer membrane beta-barrel domain-containing protein [Snodgrassella gandavensis]|uniref:autotransporter outer membrane beta-barrel domain-containing protein n=1 Tax=Snodgrassella gandavensis TaxID=2946698 RepID=UPI001EF4B0A6|nr:autotransporter outer membrane beta-barrel domain-containing protein [Snodgrassella gandavensis]